LGPLSPRDGWCPFECLFLVHAAAWRPQLPRAGLLRVMLLERMRLRSLDKRGSTEVPGGDVTSLRVTGHTRWRSGASPLLLPWHQTLSLSIPMTAPVCPDPLPSTTAILLEMSLQHKGSVSPEQHTRRDPKLITNPASSETPPNKGSFPRPGIRRVREQNIGSCHLSYSHPDLLQQQRVLHFQERPDRSNTPVGAGCQESCLAKQPGCAQEEWDPADLGSMAHALPPGLAPGTSSVCSEGCLVASKGSQLLEQGTVETRLGGVTTLGVMP